MFWRFAPALIALVSCSATDLEHRIDALVESSAPAGIGFTGIHVVDASNGAVLYQRSQDRLFLPASNLKLLTTALALEKLGRDYRFTTQVIRDSSGNLVLVGNGDPAISGRAAVRNGAATGEPANDPPDDIGALADQIVALGVTSVAGDIVGDDTAFPWEPYPPSWTQDDTLRDFGAPVSAIALHENVVSVTLLPGARPGDLSRLAVSPSFEYLTLENRVLTVGRNGITKVSVMRVGTSRQWRLDGTIAIGHTQLESLPVDDPALFAASALYEALSRRGVKIRGSPIARHRARDEAHQSPAGEAVASHTSLSLQDTLTVMNKFSINLYAEMLLRESGRKARGEGSISAGLGELSGYLKRIGAESSDWRLDDGSGLSRNDLVTPRLLTRVLLGQIGKNGADFVSLLPVGGEEGTLDRRLCCLGDGRKIQAKTGTLARSLALSGFADSPKNGRLAFSILVNNSAAPSSEVRAWIDKIATALLDESAK